MKLIAHQSILMIWAFYSCICFLGKTKTKNCNTFRPAFLHGMVQKSLFVSLIFLNTDSFNDHGYLLMPDKKSIVS